MTIEKILKNSGAEEFVRMIKDHLKKYNGKIVFKNPILNRAEIDGEFSEFSMTIMCSIDSSSNYWIGVLAHEYSHFLQCVNESKYWINFQNKVSEIDNLNYIFNNKKNIKISKRERKKIIHHIINVELDCDKRAIKLINKWKLNVNKNEYRTKANIILYKYLYWAEYGIWPRIISKKTNKQTDWYELKLNKLRDESKYKSVDDIPRKLFYLFKEN